MLRSEIICVGSEILLGEILNTNAHWLASKLSEIGIDHFYQSVVGDNEGRLSDVIKTALSRSDLLFITGGLGPTEDDITHEVIAKALGREFEVSPVALKMIENRFRSLKKEVSDSNMTQANLPEGSFVLDNKVGTAPGIELELEYEGQKKFIYTFPGVPTEFKTMFENVVLKRLEDKKIISKTASGLVKSEILLWGLPESKAGDIVSSFKFENEPSVATYASSKGVRVRLAVSSKSGEASIIEAREKLLQSFGDYVVSVDGGSLEEELVAVLSKKSKTCAVAESCTGGGVGKKITSVSGASLVFDGGVISYSNEVKRSILSVSKETLNKFGAVSKEVAEEMSVGVISATDSDFSVSVTGVAGPDGGSKEKPVGMVCFGISYKDVSSKTQTLSFTRYFGNHKRETIRLLSVNTALFLLLLAVKKSPLLSELSKS
jgi:nicotinamide-nucleotide amidase